MYEVYEANIHTVHTGQDGWLSGHWKWRFRVIFGGEKKKNIQGRRRRTKRPDCAYPKHSLILRPLEWQWSWSGVADLWQMNK